MEAVIYPDRFRGCWETLIPTLFRAVLFLFCGLLRPIAAIVLCHKAGSPRLLSVIVLPVPYPIAVFALRPKAGL